MMKRALVFVSLALSMLVSSTAFAFTRTPSGSDNIYHPGYALQWSATDTGAAGCNPGDYLSVQLTDADTSTTFTPTQSAAVPYSSGGYTNFSWGGPFTKRVSQICAVCHGTIVKCSNPTAPTGTAFNVTPTFQNVSSSITVTSTFMSATDSLFFSIISENSSSLILGLSLIIFLMVAVGAYKLSTKL